MGTNPGVPAVTNVLDEVLAANRTYAPDFGDKGKLAMPPAQRFAILTSARASGDQLSRSTS
jgi:carbonic anhydrase